MNFKCDLFNNSSLNSVFLLLHQNSNPRKIYTLYIKHVLKSLKNLPQCLPRLPLSPIPRRKFTYPLLGFPLPKISNFLPLPLIKKRKHHFCPLHKKTHSLILFGTNYSKNGPSENCGREPLKNLKWYGLFNQTSSLHIFKGSLPQISLGPFLDTLPHLNWEKYLAILHLAIMRNIIQSFILDPGNNLPVQSQQKKYLIEASNTIHVNNSDIRMTHLWSFQKAKYWEKGI